MGVDEVPERKAKEPQSEESGPGALNTHGFVAPGQCGEAEGAVRGAEQRLCTMFHKSSKGDLQHFKWTSSGSKAMFSTHGELPDSQPSCTSSEISVQWQMIRRLYGK